MPPKDYDYSCEFNIVNALTLVENNKFITMNVFPFEVKFHKDEELLFLSDAIPFENRGEAELCRLKRLHDFYKKINNPLAEDCLEELENLENDRPEWFI